MAIHYRAGLLIIESESILSPGLKLVDVRNDPDTNRLGISEMEFFSGQSGDFSLFQGDPGAGGKLVYSGNFAPTRSRCPWPGRKELIIVGDLWAISPGAMTLLGNIKMRKIS